MVLALLLGAATAAGAQPGRGIVDVRVSAARPGPMQVLLVGSRDAVRLPGSARVTEVGRDSVRVATPLDLTVELRKGSLLISTLDTTRWVQVDVLLANGSTINASAARLLVELDEKARVVVRGVP